MSLADVPSELLVQELLRREVIKPASEVSWVAVGGMFDKQVGELERAKFDIIKVSSTSDRAVFLEGTLILRVINYEAPDDVREDIGYRRTG